MKIAEFGAKIRSWSFRDGFFSLTPISTRADSHLRTSPRFRLILSTTKSIFDKETIFPPRNPHLAAVQQSFEKHSPNGLWGLMHVKPMVKVKVRCILPRMRRLNHISWSKEARKGYVRRGGHHVRTAGRRVPVPGEGCPHAAPRNPTVCVTQRGETRPSLVCWKAVQRTTNSICGRIMRPKRPIFSFKNECAI